MNDSPNAIRAAYAACRRLARRSHSNFYATFLFLPARKRRAMDALYAFMRRTDDLADNDQPVADRRRSLAEWRARLSAALGDERDGSDFRPNENGTAPFPATAPAPLGDQILPAVADTVRCFCIPHEHLHAAIDGVEMDLDPRPYETFGELSEYCHRVASAVGLACIHIWGFDDPTAIGLARQCGLAFQLTNILRDLKEDAADGRVYLPLEDFRRVDYGPDELAAGVTDQRFVRLVRLECNRAESLYQNGARLIGHLEPDARRAFGMMLDVYHRLLTKIRRDPTELLVRRIRVSRWEKFYIAASWMVRAS